MELYSPWILLLFLLLPLLAYLKRRRQTLAAVRFPSLKDIKQCPVSLRQRLRPLLNILRFICIAFLIVALARPRKGTVLSEISTEGVAIEVVADRSGSMQAEMDYFGQNLNRFDAVKKVFSDFITGNKKGLTGRSGDLIGLITFARFADTTCPLVLSHNVLLEFLKKTEIVRLRSEDGTAIGDAIALAAARLKKAEEELQQRRARLIKNSEQEIDKQEGSGFNIKSKVIILLTDGVNNAGQYDPIRAAELAKEWGIKIYSIGIGSAQAYTTIQTPLGAYKMPTGQNLDEGLLKAIAERTGGFYGRADDAETLVKIVEKINDLERTEVKSVQYAQYSERFGPWTLGALLMLALEILARCTIFRKIP
ncbi:MAG: VWA domain-containing protein [Sedimentisphaerales bacterium]|nr:VWA domain-containing protein [Sedimentisphaerales bacterium]